MTPAVPDCRRRCAASLPSIRWPTTSQPCSISLAIAGKVALAGIAVGGAIALHFAARYPERTSAVAVGSPATGIAAERRAGSAGAPRADRSRRHGVRGRGFDVERLCPGASRRHRPVRALPDAMARQRSLELCNDLANAGGSRHAGRTRPADLSGPRDRRQSRPRAPAAAGGRRGQGPFPAPATSKSAPGTTWRCKPPICSPIASMSS